MKRAGPIVLIAFLCAAFVAPTATSAQEPGQEEHPSEMVREGVERIMRALGAFVDVIPQYELPEINENGDIIIRRKRDSEPEPAPAPETPPDMDQT